MIGLQLERVCLQPPIFQLFWVWAVETIILLYQERFDCLVGHMVHNGEKCGEVASGNKKCGG